MKKNFSRLTILPWGVVILTFLRTILSERTTAAIGGDPLMDKIWIPYWIISRTVV